MFHARLPTTERIRQWLNEQSAEALTYDDVGASRFEMPSGYHHIEWSSEVGRGESTFHEAARGLQQWSCFNLTWTRAFGQGEPEAGKHLAIAARTGGMWVVNFGRVIEATETFNLNGSDSYSVTIGTLPRHVACGEETLSIRWERETDIVSFNIRSFSHPSYWWMRMAAPLVHRRQARFCRDASDAITRFVRARDRKPGLSRKMVST